MSAPHFFVEGQERLAPGDTVLLSPDDSAHALRSRRLRPGEVVTVSNGVSWLGRGRFRGERAGRAVVHVEDVTPIDQPRTPEVDVGMAPPKGDRLAWAVQKLSELGVHQLDLVRTERSIRFPAPAVFARLATIAREAAMQSIQPVVMTVREGGVIREAVAPKGNVDIVLHQGASERLGEVLPDGAARIRLLVGPEGGFTESELSRAGAAGYRVATLGPAVLRTETAAVVGAALVLARYGRLG